MSEWRPLRVRDGGSQDWEGPFEAVPPWLFEPLAGWLARRYPVRSSGIYRDAAIREYQRLGMALRIDVTPSRNDMVPDSWEDHFVTLARQDPELLLEAAHHWLGKVYSPGVAPHVKALDDLRRLLDESGSIWTVSGGSTLGLERRVSDEQREAAATTIARGTRASEYLAVAWREAYDRDPDASASYRDSVRAVEAIAIPAVIPKDKVPTLGKVLGELRAHPERIALRMHTPDAAKGAQAVIGMVEMLWEGQYGRHAVSDPSAPPDVSVEQAQDAVRLAVLLVEWFETGVVTYGAGT